MCIFILSALASPVININKDTVQLKNYTLEYFIDTSQVMGFEQLHNQTFQQTNDQLAVMMLDIDHFKAINNQHGHKAGDLVLIDVASIFQKLSREQDLIARFGGEEFVILLPSANSQAAAEYAKRIRQGIAERSIKLDESTKIKISISLGVAEMSIASQESIESTLNRADKALYQAKT